MHPPSVLPCGDHDPALQAEVACVGSAGQFMPAGQGSHPLAKGDRWRVYAGQVAQLEAPPVENVPAPQAVPFVDPDPHA